MHVEATAKANIVVESIASMEPSDIDEEKNASKEISSEEEVYCRALRDLNVLAVDYDGKRDCPSIVIFIFSRKSYHKKKNLSICVKAYLSIAYIYIYIYI